jgi:hypothetical protein
MLHSDKLDQEVVLGEKAHFAYEHFIKDFISNKRSDLFGLFQQMPLTDQEAILEIKRLLIVLDMLEIEIKSTIDTGNLASIALNKQEKH